MELQNEVLRERSMLADMYEDPFFPNPLVDKLKAIIHDMAATIEAQKPKEEEDLLAITAAAIEQINDLEDEFHENESELETGAREAIGEEFSIILEELGYEDIDLEEAMEPRDW